MISVNDDIDCPVGLNQLIGADTVSGKAAEENS
jgi:hypothetical protein